MYALQRSSIPLSEEKNFCNGTVSAGTGFDARRGWDRVEDGFDAAGGQMETTRKTHAAANRALKSAFKEAHSYGESVDIEGLCDERVFRAMLSAERRRTERTKRPFAVALIDIAVTDGVVDGAEEEGEIPSGFVVELHRETRHIDIKGWYHKDKVIGVLYPETSRESLPSLQTKLHTCLVNSYGEDFSSRIGVSWFSFPQEDGDPLYDDEKEEKKLFYPDLGATEEGYFRKAIRRVVDVIGSLTALVLFGPVFLIAPLAIMLTSKGPIFFRQDRVGEDGKLFTLLKFRSMYTDCKDELHREYVRKFIHGQVEGADQGEGGVYKITKDPRITPVGAFLRRTSFDELPQFLNVLMGDMSLVGPRPALPYEVEEYDLWHKGRVWGGKPGITGKWQVEGRSSTSFDGMVRLDIKYFEKRSIWADIKLIFKTPIALVTARGAY